jgi:hypothetical protein
MTAIESTPSRGSVQKEPALAEQRLVAVTRPMPAAPRLPAAGAPARTHVDGNRWAARIEERNVGWLVLFGAYTRELIAFPRLALPVPGWLVSRDPGRLVRLMRRAGAGAGPQRLQTAAPPPGDLATGLRGLLADAP